MLNLNEIGVGVFCCKTRYRTLYIHHLHSHLQWVFAGAWQLGLLLQRTANWSYWSKLQDQSQGNILLFPVFQESSATDYHLVGIIYKINNLYCFCFARDCSLRSPLCYAHMHKTTLLQQNSQFGPPQRQNVLEPPLLG